MRLRSRFAASVVLLLALGLAAGSSQGPPGTVTTSALVAAATTTTSSTMQPPTTTTSSPPEPTTTTSAPEPEPVVVAQAATEPVVQPAAEPAPAPEPAGPGSSLEPCGGDLPPCWVKQRESHGDYGALNPSSGASGAWQFLDSTWRTEDLDGNGTRDAYVGSDGIAYAKAMDAPPAIQDERAREVWAGGAGCSHWSAC